MDAGFFSVSQTDRVDALGKEGRGESGNININHAPVFSTISVRFLHLCCNPGCCVARISEMDGRKKNRISPIIVMPDRDPESNRICSPCDESRQKVLQILGHGRRMYGVLETAIVAWGSGIGDGFGVRS